MSEKEKSQIGHAHGFKDSSLFLKPSLLYKSLPDLIFHIPQGPKLGFRFVLRVFSLSILFVKLMDFQNRRVQFLLVAIGIVSLSMTGILNPFIFWYYISFFFGLHVNLIYEYIYMYVNSCGIGKKIELKIFEFYVLAFVNEKF